MEPTREPAHPIHSGSKARYQQRAQAKYSAHHNRAISPWAIITTTCDFDSCLRPACMTVLEPVKIEYPAGQCVYCGEPSRGYDHLMPRPWTGEAHRKHVAIVPCCAHCNSTINDTLAISVGDRRSVCHKRLSKRNRKLIQTPEYSPGDLRKLGYVLREATKAQINKKRLLEARLMWPPDPNYDRRAFEKTGLEFAEERGLI